MGVEFFKRAVELQQQYGRSGAAVANGLQTNGTLITDELAAHLAEYKFLTGVSLDGPREIHDHYRRNAADGGSYDDVMRGIGRLQQHGAEFNILILVNDGNVERAAEVYHFLCEQGFLHHQYIACVEPDENRNVLPFSISGKQWGDFLCTIFDLWYASDTRRVSIRLFDAILGLMVEGVRNMCSLGTNCCQYFVVEYNGDVFPCDFFVEKRFRLGNIQADSWAMLQQSPIYRDFGAQKRQWNARCETCEYVEICVGDCLKHRLCAGGGDPRRLSHLCEGWRQFYAHTLPKFRELARQIVEERRQANMMPRRPPAGRRPGRNAPCPCGSGKKFKNCCGR
jgi:uncharacterized protein